MNAPADDTSSSPASRPESDPTSEHPNRVPDLVSTAKATVDRLEPAGLLLRVLSRGWLDQTAELYVHSHALGRLPPLLLLLNRPRAAIRQFERDLASCSERSEQPQRVGSFLKHGLGTSIDDERQWIAGIAEVALTATLLERGMSVEVEPLLPNGRRCDAKVLLSDGTPVWIEWTVLSVATDDHDQFDYTKAVQAHTSSPYQDARRFYRKVFDKVANREADIRSQLHPQEPSVVVVVDGSYISPNLDSLGVGWAIEQLLDPPKRAGTSDASLLRFIDHDFPTEGPEALALLRHLSALGVTERVGQPVSLHRNLDASEQHQLSDDQVAELHSLLSSARGWT